MKECWEIIPSKHRSLLISEIETLCQNAGIIPGVSLTLSISMRFILSASYNCDNCISLSSNSNKLSTFIYKKCEPVGVEIEAAFSSSIAPPLEDEEVDELDDRAVRDCFLRFFCSILGGYERFLLVPDIDFLISGNEVCDIPILPFLTLFYLTFHFAFI